MKLQKNHLRSIFSELLYYILLLLLVGVLLTRGLSGKGPKTFLGYSVFIVLTGSMSPEIPQGSLVVTRSVSPETLEIGDDITYMVDEATSITHRIVGIEKHSADTGDYAFQTQGIANPRPDEKKVYAVNVVGKVIFHSVLLGTVLSAVRENWPLVLFFIAVLWLFMKVIRYILRPEEGDEEVQEMQGEETTENKK